MDVSDRERLDVEASEGAGPAAEAGNGQRAVAVAPEPVVTSAAPFALSTLFWAPLLGLSILLAAYTGFRLPNLWSATLYTPSLFEGFHRRFLVGTLLLPLSEVLDYNYWLYATVAFAILVALLVVLVVVTLRARLVSQRFLVVAFFLLPTGGFLFNEVGYLDQLIYLMLFASFWLLRRRARHGLPCRSSCRSRCPRTRSPSSP